MIEGKVMQKKLHRGGRHAPDEYRLWVMTDSDEIQVSILKRQVSDCCFLEAIPLFEKVTLLTSNSIRDIELYQITHQYTVILDGHDVLYKENEDIIEMLYGSLMLFVLGGAVYTIGLVRKIKRNT
jgi:hypothetical protein